MLRSIACIVGGISAGELLVSLTNPKYPSWSWIPCLTILYKST
jgi:hypothetical protein